MTAKVFVIGSDHAGYDLKEQLAEYVREQGYAVIDVGCHSKQSADYPDMAGLAAAQMAEEQKSNPDVKGAVICGTGIGISIAANRYAHIRCGLCHDVTTARLTRLHNDANVIALGARIIGEEVALEAVSAFLNTEFEGGRHARRVGKLAAVHKGA